MTQNIKADIEAIRLIAERLQQRDLIEVPDIVCVLRVIADALSKIDNVLKDVSRNGRVVEYRHYYPPPNDGH
jgi:hypothetical protein